jgi:hypothetical protein
MNIEVLIERVIMLVEPRTTKIVSELPIVSWFSGGREDYGSITAITTGRMLKLLDARADPQTRLNWW